jgi:hypothetical protein
VKQLLLYIACITKEKSSGTSLAEKNDEPSNNLHSHEIRLRGKQGTLPPQADSIVG